MLPPIDDKTVVDDAVIWRRVPQSEIVYDPKTAGCRPSTGAFDDDDQGEPMSGCLATGGETTLEKLLTGHDGFAVVAFRMEVARSKGLGIERKPFLPEEPDHVEIFGKKTYGRKKALVQGSQWVVPPALEHCKAPGGVCTCFPR